MSSPRPHRIAILLLLAGAALVAPSCSGSARPPKKNPLTDANMHFQLAQAHYKAGRLNESISQMDQAVALAPRSAEMANFHGQVLFLAGREAPAESSFRRALELDPYLTDAHNNLGALYDRQGKKTEAEAEFRRVLADPAYPTPEKARLNLGLLYASQGREEDAIRELRKAVEIAPRYYAAHFELAARLEATGRLAEAAREYEVAAPDFVNSAEFHMRLGFTYLRLDNPAKAAEHLRRVIALSPGSENAQRADELLRMVR